MLTRPFAATAGVTRRKRFYRSLLLGLLAFTGKATGQKIAMTSKIDCELTHLAREIANRQRYIEDQVALADVLERDGHEVLDHGKAIAKDRSDLALQIARQFRLLEEVASQEPSMDA
ncbi:hypothetical protein ACNJX9_13315 [Bradyrhizobium sp. DASA03076]|uniref:hypothetical protein n=1 Tax=Bradyrhizobium sp. BLXBL-03 TaxID=3395916 RepID=UPI003F6F5C93